MKTLTPEQLLGPLNAVEAKNAPRELHCQGDLDLVRKPRVAVVGSRAAGEEAVRRAARLSRELSRAGVVVVSGLAEGIDTAAHRAAIEEKGRTVAVLGNALSAFYPAENRDLDGTLKVARGNLAFAYASVERFAEAEREAAAAERAGYEKMEVLKQHLIRMRFEGSKPSPAAPPGDQP